MKSLDQQLNPKVVFLGDAGTGKTSIINQFLKINNDENTLPTIGALSHEIEHLYNSKIQKINIWDTAGQEIYRNLVPVFLRNANLAIFVYDCSNPSSLESLSSWHSLLMEQSQDDNIKFIVVGNKIDLPNTVDEIKVESFSNTIMAEHLNVSAINRTGIKELLDKIVEKTLNTNSSLINISKNIEEKNSCC